MDATNTVTSAAISVGMYVAYKVFQRYYLRSGCHDRTLEITIVDREVTRPPEVEVPVQEVVVDVPMDLPGAGDK
jgi:hypothetical protein